MKITPCNNQRNARTEKTKSRKSVAKSIRTDSITLQLKTRKINRKSKIGWENIFLLLSHNVIRIRNQPISVRYFGCEF